MNWHPYWTLVLQVAALPAVSPHQLWKTHLKENTFQDFQYQETEKCSFKALFLIV